MDITFKKLLTPTPEITARLNKWENDSELIPLICPNFTKQALKTREEITIASLLEQLKYNQIYLIFLNGELVGEMSYQVDPKHLYTKESGSAWVGIYIGETFARGKGVGMQSMLYLEEQIKKARIKRIELGVFEFNAKAIKLYQRIGYREIARLEAFTYWDGKMWADIRMEKRLI